MEGVDHLDIPGLVRAEDDLGVGSEPDAEDRDPRRAFRPADRGFDRVDLELWQRTGHDAIDTGHLAIELIHDIRDLPEPANQIAEETTNRTKYREPHHERGRRRRRRVGRGAPEGDDVDRPPSGGGLPSAPVRCTGAPFLPSPASPDPAGACPPSALAPCAAASGLPLPAPPASTEAVAAPRVWEVCGGERGQSPGMRSRPTPPPVHQE